MDSSTALEIVRMIGGSITVLFIPGFALSYVFFHKDSIDVIERFALSFALSIALVPLLGFYLNMLGVKISAVSVIGIVVMIVVGSGVYLYFKNIYFAKPVHGASKELTDSPHLVNLRKRHRLFKTEHAQITHKTKKIVTFVEQRDSKLHVASREIFQIFLVGYMVLTVAEVFRPGVVSNFFEMNYLLVTVLVVGVAMLLTEPKIEEDEEV